MAYTPIAPLLTNGSVLTQDHIAHLEGGILNIDVDNRDYIDQVAVEIQAGQVTDAAFDAAVDRAAADGRLPTGGAGPSEPVNVVETQPGVYEITGLTVTETTPGTYEIGA